MTEFDSLLCKYISNCMSWNNLVTLVMWMKAGQSNCDQTPNRMVTLFLFLTVSQPAVGPTPSKGPVLLRNSQLPCLLKEQPLSCPSMSTCGRSTVVLFIYPLHNAHWPRLGTLQPVYFTTFIPLLISSLKM